MAFALVTATGSEQPHSPQPAVHGGPLPEAVRRGLPVRRVPPHERPVPQAGRDG